MESSSKVAAECIIFSTLSCLLLASQTVGALELRHSGSMIPIGATKPTNATVSGELSVRTKAIKIMTNATGSDEIDSSGSGAEYAECKEIWNANIFQDPRCGGHGFNMCTTNSFRCTAIDDRKFALPHAQSVEVIVGNCLATFYDDLDCHGQHFSIPTSRNECWNLYIFALSYEVIC